MSAMVKDVVDFTQTAFGVPFASSGLPLDHGLASGYLVDGENEAKGRKWDRLAPWMSDPFGERESGRDKGPTD